MCRKYIAYDLVSLFHVYSALGYVLSQGGAKRAEFFLQRNNKNEYCLKESCLQHQEANVELIRTEIQIASVKDILEVFIKFFILLISRAFKNKSEPITVLHHSYFKPTVLLYVSIRECFNLNVVCFEEGVGTYGDLRHWRNVAKRENKKSPIIKYYLHLWLQRLCNRKIGVLKKNIIYPGYKDGFKQAVKTISDHFFNQQIVGVQAYLNKIEFDKCILVFTSPLLELGLISGEELKAYIAYLKKIHHEHQIVICPHPLEKDSLKIYKDNGVNYIPQNLSAEIIFDAFKPANVLGAFSTALLVAKNVYDLNVSNDDYFLKKGKTHFVTNSISELFQEI